jgi:hypothetical protein
MTEKLATTTNPQHKRVSIQERSVLVGETIVVDGHGVNRTSLKGRFAEGGYRVHETPHFLLFAPSEAPTTILVDVFAPEDMNADIKHFLIQQLKPLGLIQES